MVDCVITEFDEISSTNTWAKEHVSSFEKNSFQVISAKKQLAGRGRQGKSFISLEGGLYLTCAFEVPEKAKDLSALAIALGAQVADYLGVKVKWPNDLVVGKKKLGGFLIEALSGWWIVGMGINVHASNETKCAHSTLDIDTAFLEEVRAGFSSFQNNLLKDSQRIKKSKYDIDVLKKELSELIYQAKELFFEKGLAPFLPTIEKTLSHKKGDKIFIRVGEANKEAAIFEGLSEKGELLITRMAFEDKKGEPFRPVERLSQSEIIE